MRNSTPNICDRLIFMRLFETIMTNGSMKIAAEEIVSPADLYYE